MPSMLTVAETGSLSVPLVSNHDVASPLRYPGGKSTSPRLSMFSAFVTSRMSNPMPGVPVSLCVC